MAFEARVKIVVPGDDPVQIQGSPELAKLEPYGDLTICKDRPATSEEKVKRAEGATVIMNTRGSVKWGEEELRQLPDLKIISLCSIGTDMIDLKAARALGIDVCNLPGRTARRLWRRFRARPWASLERETLEPRWCGWPARSA